jgi:hypothetical protein
MDDDLLTGRLIDVTNEYMSAKEVDAHIAKLPSLKRDLEKVIFAINTLAYDAGVKKRNHDALKQALSNLESDKKSLEALLSVPEASFARVLSRASRKNRIRGIIEGALIGFLTGTVSSALVWYLTR